MHFRFLDNRCQLWILTTHSNARVFAQWLTQNISTLYFGFCYYNSSFHSPSPVFTRHSVPSSLLGAWRGPVDPSCLYAAIIQTAIKKEGHLILTNGSLSLGRRISKIRLRSSSKRVIALQAKSQGTKRAKAVSQRNGKRPHREICLSWYKILWKRVLLLSLLMEFRKRIKHP